MTATEQVRARLIRENHLPSLPAAWRVVRFRYAFSESNERNGHSPVGEMLSVSGYRGVEVKLYDFEERKRDNEDLENYRVVRPGQLAVNTMWLNHRGLGVSDVLGHVSPAYAVYSIKEVLDRRFAHHLLRSDYYLNIFKRYLYGIRPNSFQIKNDDWLSLPVVIPPIDAQKSIATFLDSETARIDQLIEKKERMATLLNERRSTVALDCLSQGLIGIDWQSSRQSFVFRFRNTAWTAMRVKSLVSFMTSGSRGWSALLGTEGEAFIQSGNIGRYMEVDLTSAQRVQPQIGAEAERTLVRQNDVLICITGGRTGAVGYVRSIHERAYINQHVCMLRARIRTIHPELLGHILWSEIGQKQIDLCQYGVKQGIGFNEVANLQIPVPPRELQTELVERINAQTTRLDNLTTVIHRSVERLRELRSSIITAAVTGQLDITSWQKRGGLECRLDAIEAGTPA